PAGILERNRVLVIRTTGLATHDGKAGPCGDVGCRDRQRRVDGLDRHPPGCPRHRDPDGPVRARESAQHHIPDLSKRSQQKTLPHHSVTSTSLPASSPSHPWRNLMSPSLSTRVFKRPDFPKSGTASS